jgi:hypothetical protein
MDRNCKDKQSDPASYHSLTTAEEYLEAIFAGGIGCSIAPVEFAASRDKEAKLRCRATKEDNTTKATD